MLKDRKSDVKIIEIPLKTTTTTVVRNWGRHIGDSFLIEGVQLQPCTDTVNYCDRQLPCYTTSSLGPVSAIPIMFLPLFSMHHACNHSGSSQTFPLNQFRSLFKRN